MNRKIDYLRELFNRTRIENRIAMEYRYSKFLILIMFSGFIFINPLSSNDRIRAADEILINALLDGLHQDAHEGNFRAYFARYTPDAIFLGTDKTERWTIEEFKAYAEKAFADGHGWTYTVLERNWEGGGDTRWFDEILFNEKLGNCRGTGVIKFINGEWKIVSYALAMLVPNKIAAELGSRTQKAEASSLLQE